MSKVKNPGVPGGKMETKVLGKEYEELVDKTEGLNARQQQWMLWQLMRVCDKETIEAAIVDARQTIPDEDPMERE